MPSALSQTSLHSFIPGAYPTAVKCFWGCKANVGDGSHFGSSIARLMSHKLKECSRRLQMWNKAYFGIQDAKQLQLQLERLERAGESSFIWQQPFRPPENIISAAAAADHNNVNDDLGHHVVPFGGEYTIDFCPNFWGTTLFFCGMSWSGKVHWFDIYDASRDSSRCGNCSWTVEATGPCMDYYNYYTKEFVCYPWNDKASLQ
uniref:S-protein homolog n=1 Tax=Salix viminalis TaxID=40686 RepID=A0A6N2M5W0_SALVM